MLITTLKGLVFDGSATMSILDTALQAGVTFEYSCKNGQCGACAAKLVAGDVHILQAQRALSAGDIAASKILTCCCAPASDILIDAEDLSALKDIEIKTLPARIHSLTYHTDELLEVQLRLPPTAAFLFLAGQFIDVIGEGGLRRSYSIANSPSQRMITLFIKSLVGGEFSRYWFERAAINDLLRLEGPKGTFFFRGLNKKLIFLATGTGIAPVKAILDQIEESPELAGDCEIGLYWGNRQQCDFFWQPDYTAISLDFVPVLSRADESWVGEVGYVQDVALKHHQQLSEAEVYACGSMHMIEAAHQQFVASGLDEKHFYADAFVSS